VPVAPPPREAGTRSLEPVGAPQHETYKKKLAVIVGINYTGSNIQLRNAEQDAQKVYDLLVGCFGYKPDEVRLLLGKNATKQAIEKALHNDFLCSQDVTADDSVLFYFSGHGDFRPRQDGRGGKGYLIPFDVARVQGKANGEISLPSTVDLADFVVKNLRLDCKARHKLLILDCCHAGSVFRIEDGTVMSGAAVGQPDLGLFEATSFQAMAASREWQPASDGDLGAGHSPFTASLIHALCTLGKKSLGARTRFSTTQLFSAMDGDLKAALQGKQSPECRWLDGARGEFHFFPDPNGQFPYGELTEEDKRMLMAMVPSTFGNWWADEMPWFMPSLRQEILALPGEKRSQNAYLDVDMVRKAAEKLAKKADDPRYAHLKALLDAKDVEARTQAMRDIVKKLKKDTERPDALPTDLHYLAVLQQKLATTPESFAEADATYTEALKRYEAGQQANDTFGPLRALCLIDHGLLCLNNLKNYTAAIAKFQEAKEVVKAKGGIPPVPFLVFATCREADANRRLGLFGKSDKLMREALDEITNFDLRSALPLSAAVWNHYAWAMMEDCRFPEAEFAFHKCQKILESLEANGVNSFQCAIDLLHTRHGLAMIKRFQGQDADAIAEFRQLTVDISLKMRKLSLEYESAVNYAEIRQLLAARYQNSLDRLGDCHLFGRHPDFAEAADEYRRAMRVVDHIPPDRRMEFRVDLMYRRAIALCLAPEATRDTAEAAHLCEEAEKLLPESKVTDKIRLSRAIARALVKDSRTDVDGHCACEELWDAVVAHRQAGTASSTAAKRSSDRDELERLMFACKLIIERRKQWKLDRFKVEECCDELLAQCRAATRAGRMRSEVDLKFFGYLRTYYDVVFAAKVEEQSGRPVQVKELIEVVWWATRGGTYTKPAKVAPVVVLYGCQSNCDTGTQFYLLIDVPAGPGQPPVSRCVALRSDWNDPAVLREASEANRPLPLPEELRKALGEIKSAETVIVRWHDPVIGLGYQEPPKPKPGETLVSSSPPPADPVFPFTLTPTLGSRVQWDVPAWKSSDNFGRLSATK
jgi:tetratricopeptide (TPR) repeat protein